MRINFIGILIAVLTAHASSESCEESRQLESTCGRYCFKVVRPILEHTRALQKQVESFDIVQKSEQMIQLESIKTLLQESNEQKLQGSCKVLETALQKQVECQDKDKSNLLAKLESIESLFYDTLEKKLHALEEKFEDKWKNLNRIVKVTDKTDKLIEFEKIGSKYYYIEDDAELNWFEAGFKCRQLGGHLASLQNNHEFDAIKAKLTKLAYWVDITYLSDQKKYVSASTGKYTVFFKWDSKNPSNWLNSEHCVEMRRDYDYLMNDLNCSFRLNFICEKKNI